MNPGGEPERDDTGLPPVDIEIPDDARDLDRDVQAYRREVRALRRTERQGRWHRSLSKDGVVLPLLACCLVLALITGTLLTVFTATSGPNGARSPGSMTSAATGPGAPQAAMIVNKPLPDASIAVEGSAGFPLTVQQLDEAMLVLVPKNCECTGAFGWLARVASTATVPVYVITTRGTQPEVQQLYNRLDPRVRVWVHLASEDGNVLSSAQAQAGIAPNQLTAMLVGPNSRATWVSDIRPDDNPAPLLQVLTGKPA